MRFVQATLALFTLAALAPLACTSGGSGTLTGTHGGGGGGGGGGDSGMSSDDGGSPVEAATPVDGMLIDDGGLGVGSPCDPNNDQCPSPPLLCCSAHGGVLDGGVFFACQRATGADGGCP